MPQHMCDNGEVSTAIDSLPPPPRLAPQLVRTPAELHAALVGRIAAQHSSTVGLVPTMGYLHGGHAQLMRRARAENALLVVSIFVNPLQFGPGEDYASYPRDLEADMVLCRQEGVDIVFAPSVEAMYPRGFASRVTVAGVSDTLDGLARPGHFMGVATVVLKLFNLVQPTCAYFGEKDWQQLSVLRRMVADLSVPVKVVGVPTVRVAEGAAAGLALSSRNSYLSEAQRIRAAVLSRTLRAVQRAYAQGETTIARLLEAGQAVLASESELQLDYLSIVDEFMQPINQLDPAQITPDTPRLLIAARLFGVRLIDNMPLVPAPQVVHDSQTT